MMGDPAQRDTPDTDNDEVHDSSGVRNSPKYNQRFDENQELSYV
jgi:hypothetical protein